MSEPTENPWPIVIPGFGKIKEPRRIVQIAAINEGELVYLFALCNDGTTWRNDWPCADGRHDEHKWIQLPEIPQ
jgi:hypothetical protein